MRCRCAFRSALPSLTRSFPAPRPRSRFSAPRPCKDRVRSPNTPPSLPRPCPWMRVRRARGRRINHGGGRSVPAHRFPCQSGRVAARQLLGTAHALGGCTCVRVMLAQRDRPRGLEPALTHPRATTPLHTQDELVPYRARKRGEKRDGEGESERTSEQE